jgi:hypothetical protein
MTAPVDRSVGLSDLAARVQAGPTARRARLTKEVWRAVPDFPFYSVSNLGRVKSRRPWRDGKAERFLSPREHWHKNGYITCLSVVLSNDENPRRVCNIGSLVLEAFVGPRPTGQETCHGDGDPTNNRQYNLRWDTRKGNISDCINHCRFYFNAGRAKGSSHARSKLTEDTVRQARKLSAGGISNVQIMRLLQLNVAQTTLGKAIRGLKWAHVHG